MQHYGIIGYPLRFSFSQNYFTKKFLDEGIVDASYSIYPIERAEGIKNILQFINSNRIGNHSFQG